MGSGSTQHASRARNYQMRLQWLARCCIWVLVTCPACRVNGHGRVTAVMLFLLAVARQFGIGIEVPNHLCLAANAQAVVHHPRRAALVMGHLLRVHDAAFSKPDPQTHPQTRQQSWCGNNARRNASY